MRHPALSQDLTVGCNVYRTLGELISQDDLKSLANHLIVRKHQTIM